MNKAEIIEDIKLKIFSEQYPPGAYLIERDLCEYYGVSRTPMREILFTLVNKGLLTQQRSKGFAVRMMDFKQLFEIFEAREGVEGTAARLCCRKATKEDKARLAELRDALAAVDIENDSDEGIRLGRNLHQAVMEIAGNSMLADFFEILNNIVGLTSNMTKKVSSIEEASRLYHMHVIEAVLEGDEERCERYMREHISMTCRNLLRHLYPGFSAEPAVVLRSRRS